MGSGSGKNKRVKTMVINKPLVIKKELTLDNLGKAIRSNLTDDLLKPEYQNAERPYTGHCYVASETYYHLMGGKEAGYKAVGIKHEGVFSLVDRG